jgi:hypothetical protein
VPAVSYKELHTVNNDPVMYDSLSHLEYFWNRVELEITMKDPAYTKIFFQDVRKLRMELNRLGKELAKLDRRIERRVRRDKKVMKWLDRQQGDS